MTRGRRLLEAAAGLALLSGCATPAPEATTGLRGVGTPGVSAYPAGASATTVDALVARCRQAPRATEPTETDDLAAACAQLRRTMHNQPGNAAAGAEGV